MKPDWLASSAEWLETDYRLMTSDEGWTAGPRYGAIEVDRRRMPDDPNELFRWKLPDIGAPHDHVFEAFVARVLDYHQHWTKEFVGGHVVERLRPDARIVYQRFHPGVPGVRDRDLCYAEVTRTVSGSVLQASYRSVDAEPRRPRHERIQWWGANLCINGPTPGRSSMIYLDRENQGGRFPSWLMNLLMPRYLRAQAEQIARFFEGGGPPRAA